MQRKRVQFRFKPSERPLKRQRVDPALTRRAVVGNELEYEQLHSEDRSELTGELRPATVGVPSAPLLSRTRLSDESRSESARDPHNAELTGHAPATMSGLLGSIRLPRSAVLGNFDLR
jgi:hypothetical protein